MLKYQVKTYTNLSDETYLGGGGGGGTDDFYKKNKTYLLSFWYL
jgi:hypothetical protein